MTIARVLAVLGALFVAGPMFIVIPMSFSTSPSLDFPPPGYWLGWYARFFTEVNWTGPMLNSLLIASATMVFTMLIAVPASFALVRHDFPGKRLFNWLLVMPLIVPHIVMAVGYYTYFGQLGLVQTYTGVILAHTCLCIPVATLVLTAALKHFDRNLERASASLGAHPLTTFRLVTFPVMRPAFLVAGLFAFVYSFDETVVALFISGRDRATLPRQMFNSFFMEADPVISAASSVLFGLVLLGVGIAAASRLVKAKAAGLAPA